MTVLEPFMYRDIENYDKRERFDIIHQIHSTQKDESWNEDTFFIAKKYLYNPASYQVFDIAVSDERTIAYIIIRKSSTNTSYLSYMAVDHNKQRKGVGSAILASSIEKIRELGVRYLKLDCEETNVGFYEKFAAAHAFSVEKEYVGSYRSGSPKFQLCLTINSASKIIDKEMACLR